MSRLADLRSSLGRLNAMVVRYRYLMLASWPRLIELAYWPTVQMVLWGLINRYLAGQSEWIAQTSGLLIAATLLWDVLYRSQLGVSLVFFEELYSRNLGNLFVSPLRPHELALSLLAVSFLRTAFGIGIASSLAILLYHYSLYDMGLPLVAFFANLMVMGWAIGLIVVALVLRFGLGMEGFAWAILFAFAPLSGVYYPVAVLPGWLQPVAWALPSSHVFEGMRTVLRDRVFSTGHFLLAVELNLLYLALGLALFGLSFRIARQRGLLLQIGE